MKNFIKTICILVLTFIAHTIDAQNYTTFTITNNSTTCTPVQVTIWATTGSYGYSVSNGTPVSFSCQLMGIPQNIQFTDGSGNEFTVPPNCTCSNLPCASGGSQFNFFPTCGNGGCVGSGGGDSSMTLVQNPPGTCGLVGSLYTLNINFW